MSPPAFPVILKEKTQRGLLYAIHCFYLSRYLCCPAHSLLTLPSGGKIQADSAVLLILSLLFRLAGKFRLTLPLLYFLLTATVLNPWASAHETLAFAILFCLLALSVISWLFSLRNALRDRKYYKALEEDMSWQVRRARNNGISMDSVYFDSAGNMRYKDTKEIVD